MNKKLLSEQLEKFPTEINLNLCNLSNDNL